MTVLFADRGRAGYLTSKTTISRVILPVSGVVAFQSFFPAFRFANVHSRPHEIIVKSLLGCFALVHTFLMHCAKELALW